MKIVKLREEAIIPNKKYNTDTGYDLYAVENTQILPFSSGIVLTGIAIEFPKGIWGWITNKSRSNYLIGAGIVDNGYRGEIKIRVFNLTNETINFKAGDAVAQLVLLPLISTLVEVTNELSLSDRGSDGGINRV